MRFDLRRSLAYLARLVFLLLAASLSLGALGCGGKESAGLPGGTYAALTVRPPNATLVAGKTVQLSAERVAADGTTTDVTKLVSWTTSDSAVATIDAAGLALAVKQGVVTVTAESGGTKGTAMLLVKDRHVTTIQLTPATAMITFGAKQAFKATGNFTDGTTEDLTASCTWSSSDPTVAAVDATGSATGLKDGTTTISANSEGINGTAALTVISGDPVSIEVTPSSASILAGSTQAFTAIVHMSDKTTLDVTATATWSSDNPSVATVDAKGVATGVAAAVANITASFKAMTGTAALTVTNPVIKSIAVTPLAPSIDKGSTQAFTAIATSSSGATLDVTSSMTWSSSKLTVATMTGNVATGVARGTSTITATDGVSGVTGTATLTVTEFLCVSSISISPSATNYFIGADQDFTAIATDTNGATRDVSASASGSWSLGGAILTKVGSVAGPAERYKGLSAGSTTIAFTLSDPTTVCKGGDTTKTTVVGHALVNITSATVTGVTITNPAAAAVKIPKGEGLQLTVTGTFSDSSVSDITSSTKGTTYTSDSAAIVTVSADGLVSAIGVGTTSIHAKNAGSTADLSVTVQDCGLPAVSISTSVSGNLPVGRTHQYTATAVYAASTTCTASGNELGPYLVTAKATWASSSPTIAGITTGASGGLATALTVGTTGVTATYRGVTSPSSWLNVVSTVLTALSIFQPSPTILVGAGGAQTISVVAAFQDSSCAPSCTASQTYTGTTSVSWVISDGTLFTIDPSNRQTALASGTTVFFAQVGTIVSNTLTITAGCASTIDIVTPAGDLTVPKGASFAATVSCVFPDGTRVPCAPTFASAVGGILSDRPMGASFPAGGLALISPSATVGATTKVTAMLAAAAICGSKTSVVRTITVGSATLASVAITPASVSGPRGWRPQYGIVGTYSGGTGAGTNDLTTLATIAASDETLATVDSDGTGHVSCSLKDGTNTLTASYGGATSPPTVLSCHGKVLSTLAITAEPNKVGGATASAAYPVGRFSLQLHAGGTYSDLTPSGDITDQVIWSLQNASTPSIVGDATVTPGGLFTTASSVTGVQRVRAAQGSVVGTFDVTMVSGAITAITIKNAADGVAPTSLPNSVTTNYAARATIGSSDYWVTRNVDWLSSDTGKASVVVTGPRAGQAQAIAGTGTSNITAVRGLSTGGPLVVSMSAATLSSLACAPSTVTVAAGEAKQLHANATFSDLTLVEVTIDVGASWSVTTGFGNIDNIDHKGWAIGMYTGTSIVQATFGGKTTTCSIVVP